MGLSAGRILLVFEVAEAGKMMVRVFCAENAAPYDGASHNGPVSPAEEVQ